MPVDLDFRNTNTLWCSVLVETLVRCGLRHVVISPGSRSSPLTVAFTRHPEVVATPVLDERSAGFFALGVAKRTHRPIALVCTSGTAAANYLPAVVEAHESTTPLLVLTADRPSEMRACASGQTIDQLKLYGGFVELFHEMPVPEARLELLRYVRQTIAHAFERTLRPRRGPVHVNLPFRDPLAPLPEEGAGLLRAHFDEAFFEHLRSEPAGEPAARAILRSTTTRGLIVAGPANPRNGHAAYAAAVAKVAADLNWPVLADALSPLRHHGGGKTPVIAHYDVILRDREAARALLPRMVICLDDWPTSKALRAWLGESQAEIMMVSDSGTNRDALHGRTRTLPFAAESLAVEGNPAGDASYMELWQRASEAAVHALSRGFDAVTGMFEPTATRLLAQHVPVETTVFVASSMPVRDVEYFWPRTDRRHHFVFNRGANGIDGTLSTALGVAHAGDTPVVLLTGDLAFLHDSNGLLLHRRLRASLTVVLINNRGGGIFEHLPVAQFDPPFEEFFATPQEIDFGRLCAAHGVDHVVVENWAQFTMLISHLPATGVRVLEIRTDRKSDAATRKRLFAEASRAVGAALA